MHSGVGSDVPDFGKGYFYVTNGSYLVLPRIKHSKGVQILRTDFRPKV